MIGGSVLGSCWVLVRRCRREKNRTMVKKEPLNSKKIYCCFVWRSARPSRSKIQRNLWNLDMHQKSDVPSHGPVCGGLTARVYLGIGWKGLVDEYFISYMDPSTNRHEHQIKRTLNCRQLSNPKNDVFSLFSLYLSDNLFVPGDSPPLRISNVIF